VRPQEALRRRFFGGIVQLEKGGSPLKAFDLRSFTMLSHKLSDFGALWR
jgi:hypothetical protein